MTLLEMVVSCSCAQTQIIATDLLVWPNGEKMPDEDPMDQMGHGTHVTGIIVGRNDWWAPHLFDL
jgi:subtilisin family serine protease